MSILHALSDERTSDLMKAIMFNMSDATDGMIEAAKNQDKISMMKLYSKVKDPDIAAGMSVMSSFLKFMGTVMKKVD